MFALRRNIPSTLSRNFSTSARNNSFAKLTLIGRLADKPEITATSQGQEIMKYAIGTNSGRGENAKTSWFRVVSFMPEGPQRDFISGLDKGYALFFLSSEGNFCRGNFQGIRPTHLWIFGIFRAWNPEEGI